MAELIPAAPATSATSTPPLASGGVGSLVPPSAAIPTISKDARAARASSLAAGKTESAKPAPSAVEGSVVRSATIQIPAAKPVAPPPPPMEMPVKTDQGPSSVVRGPAVAETAPVEEVVLPDLSNEAIAFLTSKYYASVTEDVAKKFDLSADDLTFLNEMDHLVLGKSLTLKEYVAALRSEFPQMDAKKKEELLARLIAERFMPWGDALVPSAQTVSREEKIYFPSVPYYAVYTKPLTYGGAAGEVARMAEINIQGAVRERLRDLIMSKVKGIRIDAQIEEQLARPADFGGLGLTKEQAGAAMDAVNDILKRAKVMTEDDYSVWLAGDMRAKAEVREPGTGNREPDEDGEEIAAIKGKMPQPVRDTASVLALSTETILKRLSSKPADEYLLKRLENIVSTRLRDVRSRNEVLMKLMRDAKVGGVGLERKDAEKVSEQIEEGYKEFHGIIGQEEKEKLGVQLKDQERKILERKKREAEEHARWFEEKVKVKSLADEEQKKMVEKMRIIAQGLTTPIQIHPIDVKEEKKEKAAFGELVPVKPSPPVPPPTPAFKPVVKVSAETAKAAEATAVQPRPRMDDVQVVHPRLSGPVQEIADITLATFRRLGKTPADAAKRMLQKVELLAQESFERRVQAIQAWQGSALQKAYVSLVAEAFGSGTPVNALVEKKRAAGENVMTSEELAAIVELNGKLRL